MFTNTALDPTSGTCGTPGNCLFIIAFDTGITLNSGDVVNLDVTFTSPFSVPGATGQSAIYGAVLDTNYFNCAEGLPSCAPLLSDSSVSTETLPGYSGPSITTGNNFAEPGFYVAYSYVLGPNGGFSVTGFDATFAIQNSDPSPIEAVAVESQDIDAPEPGTIALTFAGLGFLFVMRKRFLASAGQLA
ncbi:MAG TPA: PEP-CTERM sorting domain-containing protein [Candidatus Eisenbacteria bacterium]|nr:PEP-CTERM sorting domain-containing protein [Candidatus Eisenbacteria bacterium]